MPAGQDGRQQALDQPRLADHAAADMRAQPFELVFHEIPGWSGVFRTLIAILTKYRGG
jgi:hypothetical protein